jgi:hypothetical protein
MSTTEASDFMSRYSGSNNGGIEAQKHDDVFVSRVYLHGYLSHTSGINDFPTVSNKRARAAREMGIKDALGDLGKE